MRSRNELITRDMADRTWPGRFPRSEIISRFESRTRHNLSESTAVDLRLGELLDLVGIDTLRDLPLGYASPGGLLALREAVGGSCGLPAEEVVTTHGAALGLFLLAFELCRPGDEVVLTTPCFSLARDTLGSCGAQLRTVALRFEDGYELDASRVIAALTPATRLVSLASPHNPSGVPAAENSIRLILDAMSVRAPDAVLFVDETYREASYGDEHPPPSMASLDKRIITASSLSKAHGVPGLRVGWLTVPDPAIRLRLTLAKVNIVISGSVLDEALAAALLVRGQAVLASRRRLLSQSLDLVFDWQESEAYRLDWVRPQVGALCCLRLRPSEFGPAAVERFWGMLARLELKLAPGTWFGEERRVFRLGFGYLTVEELTSALANLSCAMDHASIERRTRR
jgi:aspartate/methionine/tyrosine aminotransferase